jgi:hypothetical protein
VTATQQAAPAGWHERPRRLQANRRQFLTLLDDCERELARGRPERAAVRAQVAATYAWFNHTGAFTSYRLERVLARLGEHVSEPAALPSGSGRGGLLHVATRLHQTGGHTQMLANWVATDTAHRHRVCLTHQATVPLPDKLTRALGGVAVRLDDHDDGFLARAGALRALARDADAVVLHVHPSDVVAPIALADPGLGCPVLLVNHADHVFWVGTGVADRVVNLRRSGEQLTVDRRGVPPTRNAILVRPLALPPRERTRAAARRVLGLPEDRILLVTAAAGSKYEPVGGTGFLDLVEPVLDEHPDAYLVAAGPAPEGRWRDLEASGRGRALGLLPDAHALLEAADIYLDSFPFSSLTSLLEAGSLGTPAVTVRPPTVGADVLGADTPELDEHLVVAEGGEDLRRLLGELVRDTPYREELGEATAAAIRAAHAEGEWVRRVAGLCDAAVARGPYPPLGPEEVRWDELDQRVALVQQRTGLGQGLLGTWAVHRGHLTAGERLVLFAELVRRGHRPSPTVLVPERWRRWARGLRRVGRRGQRHALGQSGEKGRARAG